MDAICNEEVWWREEELAVGSANVKGLKEKADHIEVSPWIASLFILEYME